MGIRINKVLGYGIHMTPDEAATLLNEDAVKQLARLTGEEYLEFLKAKYAEVSEDELDFHLNDSRSVPARKIEQYKANRFITLHDTAEETPHESVWLVVTPPLVCDEWKHHDDAIDYYEEAYKNRDSENPLEANIKFFKHGLFPYEGSFINHETGETFNADLVVTLRQFLRTERAGDALDYDIVRLLLASLKLSSVEEFETLIRPAPPVSVRDLVEWTGVFKDAAMVRKLQPALLTFWR